MGLLALVRAAGGFPYVAKNGAIMSPAGKMLAPAPGKGPETLAPPFGKSGMPGAWDVGCCLSECVCLSLCVVL